MSTGLSSLLMCALTAGHRAYKVTAQNAMNKDSKDFSALNCDLMTQAFGHDSLAVQTGEVTRAHDPFLLKKLGHDRSDLEFLRQDAETYEIFARTLGGLDEHSSTLCGRINEFFSALEQPNLGAAYAVYLRDVTNKAELVAESFREMADLIQGMRREIDTKIGTTVERLQGLVNNYHLQNEAIGASWDDSMRVLAAQDQKDLLLLEISTYLRVTQTLDRQCFEENAAQHSLWGPDGIALVTRMGASKLEFQSSFDMGAEDTLQGGSISGLTVICDALENDLTPHLKTGKLASLFAMRDEVLPGFSMILDQAAQVFADKFNHLHNQQTAYRPSEKMVTSHSFEQTQTLLDSGVADIVLGIVDEKGEVLDTHMLVLNASTTINDIINQVNAFSETFAYFQDGKMHLGTSSSGDDYRGLVLRSPTENGKNILTRLGLNDLFVSDTEHVPQDKIVSAGFANSFQVRADILENATLFAHGMWRDEGSASLGDTPLQSADVRGLEALAVQKGDTWEFGAVGHWKLSKSLKPFEFGQLFITELAQQKVSADHKLSVKETGSGVLEEAYQKMKAVDPLQNNLDQAKWSSYIQNIMSIIAVSNRLHQTFLQILRA